MRHMIDSLGYLGQAFSGMARISCLICVIAASLLALPTNAVEAAAEVPLIIGNRTIHVFRSSLGAFSAADRATGAQQRIERALEETGKGWTSVKSTPQGVLVELDGKPMFYVLSGDALELAGETPEDLANHASRVLSKTWAETRERRDPQMNFGAIFKVVVAAVLLILLLTVIFKGVRWIEARVTRQVVERLKAIPGGHLGSRIETLFPVVVKRVSVLMAWLLSLFVLFLFMVFSLGQFVLTRPASENLSQSINGLLMQVLHGVTSSLPGLFISVLIFLAAWVVTRVSTEIFMHVVTSPTTTGVLNAHTAPATRRIVNASIWLFAVAMAYPYLPGAHTEAFKGLSVILGLMVSIGASGLIGQVASGVMLVYTHALLVGEYVRIQDYEGTVTDLGPFVTRLRTGMGEEIALPNALVLANVTRNYSRATKGKGFIFDTSITIGYDTPWRQVHALLLEAATQIPEILAEPPPFVVQTALSDFYVAYKLVVYVDSERPGTRARVASNLHAAIQDAFNRHEVQIMSPHYFRDPEQPKIVPEANWYQPPAKPIE